MAELIAGEIAQTVEQAGPSTAPPRPFRVRESGRRAPDAAQWARPLPPLLWGRLDDEQRAAHERAVETYAEAAAKARELAVKARQAAADDEQALRQAVSEGDKPSKQKAPGLEAAAEEAKRAERMAGELVLESGGALAEHFSDEDIRAAIAEAKETAATSVAAVPALVERLLEELSEAGRLGGEQQWCGRLLERRLQAPWRPTSAPASHRLAAAAQHANELRTYAQAELSEREWKAAGPPQHHAPPGAPPAGTWQTSGIDPTK